MKISQLLSTAAFIAVISATPALAQDMSGEVESQGQPFYHPSDDQSYAKDVREDDTVTGRENTSGNTTQASGDETPVASARPVPYVSGGVGDSGMDALKGEEDAYNLKTLFVMDPNGEYLSNVNVKIANSKGQDVLTTKTNGPELLAKLPPGDYTITAMSGDSNQTITRHIETGKSHLAECVFRFRSEMG